MIEQITSDHTASASGPVVRAIVGKLSRRIHEGHLRGGERLPPIRDLAREMSASFGAVHAAIRSLQDMGLVERFHGSGTYVRRGIRTDAGPDATATIPWAYLFTDSRPHVHGELAELVIGRLQEMRIGAVKAAWSANDPINRVEFLLGQFDRHPPRALVVQGFNKSLDDLIRRRCPRGTRVITVFRPAEWTPSGWHRVNPDFTAAYSLAVDKLLASGHRRIGVLAKKRVIKPDWPTTARKAWLTHTEFILAVGRRLREAGLHEAMTVLYNLPVNDDPSGIPTDEPNIEHMARWLASPNRPTAVIGDAFRMIGLKMAARRVGLGIPEDLTILGVGSPAIGQAAGFPVISLRYDLMARHVAELITICDQDLGEGARHVLVPPCLVHGQEGLDAA